MPDTCPSYFPDLYRKSGAEKLGLAFEEFGAILIAIGARYLPPNPGAPEAKDLFHSLRIEDLALARSCARASEAAWIIFLDRYRPRLYQLALSIARDESIARELADGLFTDLFGTRQRNDGGRISKLESYTGRGSLEGWLKTVLAQEYINRFRACRNLVSFDEQVESGAQFPARSEQPALQDPRLGPATGAALTALPAEDRLILASYYLDQRTLAEIARMLAVHESTISRRLEKITSNLRKVIVKGLRERGVGAHEAEQLLHSDVRELNLDVAARLTQVDRKKPVSHPFYGEGPLR
jgi:RNA polymerase sigma-70 factor, ECF subfamily